MVGPAALLGASVVLIAACTGATGGTGATDGPDGPGATPAPASDAAWAAAALVDLVRPEGEPFALADLGGHPALVFFGYTHCPDVCPATIGELLGVLEARPEARAVFVSVDPERDSVDFLGRWTRYFPPRFIALTGSPGAIRHAADGFGVRYARVETTSTAGYTMSHTAEVFLIDGQGQLRTTYPFGTSAGTMIEDLAGMAGGPGTG
jgi:protein SCO1